MLGTSDIINFALQTLNYVLITSMPIVLAAAVSGILVSLLQALTQVQEQTLPFAIKLLAVTAALGLTFQFIGAEFAQFTRTMFDLIARL